MPIRRDMGSLPAAKPARKEGWAPDPEPVLGRLIVDAWFAKQEKRPRSRPEARFRHSDAAGCSRAIAYAALDIPESNPLDAPGAFVIEMGHIIHAAWQDALVAVYGPEARIEVICGEGEFAGHIDALVCLRGRDPQARAHDGEYRIALEGKSVGGYAYQLAVGVRGTPEGPRWSAVVQAALNAHYADADEAKVIYWARDAVSVQMAKRKNISDVGRVTAEWTLTRDEYEPIAQAEIERVNGIMALLDEGVLPARKIPFPEQQGLPARHLIVRPSDGSWVEYARDGQVMDTGQVWQCAYCRWQDMCQLTPTERCSINDLKATPLEEDHG